MEWMLLALSFIAFSYSSILVYLYDNNSINIDGDYNNNFDMISVDPLLDWAQ